MALAPRREPGLLRGSWLIADPATSARVARRGHDRLPAGAAPTHVAARGTPTKLRGQVSAIPWASMGARREAAARTPPTWSQQCVTTGESRRLHLRHRRVPGWPIQAVGVRVQLSYRSRCWAASMPSSPTLSRLSSRWPSRSRRSSRCCRRSNSLRPRGSVCQHLTVRSVRSPWQARQLVGFRRISRRLWRDRRGSRRAGRQHNLRAGRAACAFLQAFGTSSELPVFLPHTASCRHIVSHVQAPSAHRPYTKDKRTPRHVRPRSWSIFPRSSRRARRTCRLPPGDIDG